MINRANNINDLDKRIDKILRRMDWAPFKVNAVVKGSPLLIILNLAYTVFQACRKEDGFNESDVRQIFLCMIALLIVKKLIPVVAHRARIDDFSDYKNILDLIENAPDDVISQRKAAYVITLKKFYEQDIIDLQRSAPFRFQEERLRALLISINDQIFRLVNSYGYQNLEEIRLTPPQSTSLVGKFHEISNNIVNKLTPPASTPSSSLNTLSFS